MRPTLWFVMPAYGRLQLAQICLRQLRRTCDLLEAEGIDATAVVVADDENLDTARDLGFGTVQRDNEYVSRKFNDGIAAALDPSHNPWPADYVVPIGSDDWVDHRLFLNLPPVDTILAFRQAAFVNEDGTEIVSRLLEYPAGVGIRVYSRQLMGRCGYRPADEDRRRACDTSILVNLTAAVGDGGPPIMYGDQHAFQVVDWKTPGEQLNDYAGVVMRHRHGTPPTDPFDTLAGVYPDESVDAMRSLYASRTLVAA